MVSLTVHVSAIVSVLHRFNKVKPEVVTAKRVENNCSQITESISVLHRKLGGSSSRASGAVGLYADAGLLKLLVPFLVRLQGSGIADETTNPCEQLGFRLWEGCSDLLLAVVALANKWHATSPTLAKKVAKAVLPDCPSLPGERCQSNRS
jgi:hypothetical protein